MTGGQMARPTLLGAKTTTTPYGRNEKEHGAPMHMCELLNQLDAPAYIARVTAADVPNAKKAKAAVKKAFQYQLEGKGFSFVEFVSNCPTTWGHDPDAEPRPRHNVILKEFHSGNSARNKKRPELWRNLSSSPASAARASWLRASF